MKPESMDKYSFPGEEGGWWKSEEARPILEGDKI
jgi:L-galactonate dehydratase